MMSGIAVCEPWPISTAGLTIQIVPSGERLAQALTVLAPPAGVWASGAPLPSRASGVAAQPSRRMPKRSEGTRLNSSHSQISYAVFCLKKKKKKYWEFVLFYYTIVLFV